MLPNTFQLVHLCVSCVSSSPSSLPPSPSSLFPLLLPLPLLPSSLRGRYDFTAYPTFIQLHGKTYDYKIPYEMISRQFLLPHLDQRKMYFVLAVDPPLKQGQTRYPLVIMQFSIDEDCSLTLPMEE